MPPRTAARLHAAVLPDAMTYCLFLTRRFWQCPQGKECKYRHALPPGYVLKSQMKELLEAEKANAPSIEEEIEAERAKVDARTPITEEVHLWIL